MESKNRIASNCREDDDDEERMVMFFAMMKNFRNKLQRLQGNSSNTNKRKRTSGDGGGWAPVFRLEDFTSEIEFKKHVPNPCNNFVNQDVEPPPNVKLSL
ncbi:hypothetical protein ACS0TY_005143 [Phlomoides rotata]